jgi:O-antigen ligase
MNSKPPVIVIEPPSPDGERSYRRVDYSAPSAALGERLLRWGLFALLIFGPLAFGEMEPWSLFALQVGASLLFVGWAVFFFKAPEPEFDVNPLFAPMGMFALVVVAQIVLGMAQYRQLAVDQAARYVAYAMLALVASQVLREENRLQNFLIACSVFGAALALFAIIQDFTSNGALYWVRFPREGGTIFGPYVNRNHYAGLMELLSAPALVLSLSRRFNGPQRALLALAAVLMGVSIFMSGSRAGSAAFVCQVVFIGLVMSRSSRKREVMWLAPVVLVAVAAALFWIDGSHAFDRFTSVRMKDELVGGRLAINKDALRMWKDHPMIGFGLGNFANAYPRYRSFYTDFFVNEMHDDYLQVLVETGILGFAACMWFVVTLWVRGIASLRRGWEEGTGSSLRFATLAGCAGILVHSVADFNLHIPANAAIFYVLALVTASAPKSSYRRELPRSWK